MSNNTHNSSDALKQWEHENNVKTVDYDQLFKYDEEENTRILEQRPWSKDPRYFKTVKISALALLKMIMHARSGGNLEVMGMLQGKVVGKSFVVLDTFALPVEGTETRVNAGAQAIEYTGRYVDMAEEVGRLENLCGWYHSHPGYLCWLSGIDLNTQQMNQSFQDPWVAIVVDPIHTISSGKVTIGAFRSFPEGYTEENQSSGYKSIPREKIQDFGVHWKYYYELDIEIFKSSTDSKLLSLVWNKYWIKTLSSTPLIVNKDYLTQQAQDLSSKLKEARGTLSRGTKFGGVYHHVENGKDEEDNVLENINRDNCKLACEALRGLITFQIKNSLFNTKPQNETTQDGDIMQE